MFLAFRCYLALLANTVALTQAHMCITDPPQRLATGNTSMIDCYQNSNPPCGKDFPQTSSTNPKTVRPGSEYAVHLHMPTRHFMADKPGSYVINIQKSGTDEFLPLGKWPDGPEEYKILTVRIPKDPGNYILQAIYQPSGRAYYSCADVTVLEDSSIGNSQLSSMAAYKGGAQVPQYTCSLCLTLLMALLMMARSGSW